jgi:Na+-transporting methylmalonyl-CoA/oxaloacetate decarboxylase gamma subunit
VTYNSGYGYSGWFFAANEISDIIAIIAPVGIFTAVGYLHVPDEHKWKTGLLVGFMLFCCCFASDYIGTKVVFLFVFLYCLACTVWYFSYYRKDRDPSLKKRAVFCLAATIAVIAMFSSGSLLGYLSNVFLPMKDEQSEEALLALNKEILAAAQGTWLYDLIENNQFFKTMNWILSKRLLIIAPAAQEYTDGGIITKLIGLGYKNTILTTRNIERLIEMDAPALLLRHGIAGFVLEYLPYLASVIYLIVKFCKRFRKSMASLECCTYFFCVLTAFLISTFVGHGLNAPAVSFYLAFFALSLVDAFKRRDAALPDGK